MGVKIMRSRSRRARIIISWCSTLLFTAPTALLIAEDGEYNWAHPNEVIVTEEETAFTDEYLGASKNESAYLWVYDPDGTVLMVGLFHVDAFMLDRWGMFALVAESDGSSRWFTNTPAGREVEIDEQRLYFDDGETLVEGRNGSYHIATSFESGFACDIRVTNRIAAWKPGTGRVDYTEEGELFQMRILVSPWADASGTITVDERTFPIAGHGYLSKTRFANPLTRFAPYVHALKLYDEDDFIYLLDVTLAEEYDSRTVPMLIFAHDDSWVLTTREYEFEVEEWEYWDDLPHPYPVRIRIAAEADGSRLEGVYRQRRVLNVTDVFSELPLFIREMVDLVLSRPVYFRTEGRFDGTVTAPDGTVRELTMSGPYEYTVVR
jgi:hypothetical protein